MQKWRELNSQPGVKLTENMNDFRAHDIGFRTGLEHRRLRLDAYIHTLKQLGPLAPFDIEEIRWAARQIYHPIPAPPQQFNTY